MAVAQGMAASRRLHWSSAAGWERTTLISSSGTAARPTRQWRIGRIVSSVIESEESYRRSCVSFTGPESELSIGSTPKATSPAAVAFTTAVKLGIETRSAPSAKRRSQAAALWAPSRPG